MFPLIDKKETGINLRRIMDSRNITPRDVQRYLGLGCVQSVYRWLEGISMPSIDNLYALSELLQTPIDEIVCGNRVPIKHKEEFVFQDARSRRLYTYYRKIMELRAA